MDNGKVVESGNHKELIKNKKYYEFGDNKTEQTAKLYWDKVKGEKGNG